MLNRLHTIINKEDSTEGRIFDYFISILIILSILLLCLETFSISTEAKVLIDNIEIGIILIFSIEWGLRAIVAKKLYPNISPSRALVKYTFSPYSIIDLLTILPFYLSLILPISISGHIAFRALRLTRLLRFTRFSKSLKILIRVFLRKKDELIVTTFLSMLLLLIISILIYHAEHEAQPEQFANIIDALWWGTATLTTVGYGDLAPVTGTGKLIASISAFLGIGVFALPTAILGASFMEEFKKDD